MKRIFLLVTVATVLVFVLACTKFNPQINSLEEIPGVKHPVLLDAEQLVSLKKRINKREEPTYSAWKRVLRDANQQLNHIPKPPKEWHVPLFYKNPEGHRKSKAALSNDANNAYALSLAYQITGDEKYAKSSLKILNAWANRVKTFKQDDDSKLVFSTHFPTMIIAASLLEESESWSMKDQKKFKSFVKYSAEKMNTMDRENNWGNWGLLLSISAATYLDDEVTFNRSINRWKSFIDHQIDEKGHLKHEVTRNNGNGDYGIWYSHFSMQPQALSAEIASVNGVSLFDYISPTGKSMKKAYDQLVKWTSDPKTFPYHKGSISDLKHVRKIKVDEYKTTDGYPASISYFEVLNDYYDNKFTEKLLKKERPLSSIHSFPYLTFTHGK